MGLVARLFVGWYDGDRVGGERRKGRSMEEERGVCGRGG